MVPRTASRGTCLVPRSPRTRLTEPLPWRAAALCTAGKVSVKACGSTGGSMRSFVTVNPYSLRTSRL